MSELIEKPRVRAVGGETIPLYDGLANIVANLGTPRDKSANSFYVNAQLGPEELRTMYRNSWLARAIVDYPAEDATRKWRFWRAEADQITRIEALENRLGLQRKIQEALVAARLYGWSLLYINTASATPAEPLRAGEEVRSLVLLTPQAVTAGPVVKDINSPYYGNPESFELNGERPVTIHASRFVMLRGASLPAGGYEGWRPGDSVLQATLDAIKGMDSTMANIASLVFEAKVDVFAFQGFAEMLAQHQDSAVLRRLTLQAAMKGINGAVVLDAQDSYDQKSASFAGLPEVVSKFQDNVAGAAGIPVTRLYGRAAVGLSGSGDGDERVYYDRIGHSQATEVGPSIALLDDCIIQQALGSRPDTIYYEWAPLRQLSESERADVFQKTAQAARAIAGANAGEIIPMDALSDSLVNELTEQGVMPGLDQAVERYGSYSEQNDFIGGEE